MSGTMIQERFKKGQRLPAAIVNKIIAKANENTVSVGDGLSMRRDPDTGTRIELVPSAGDLSSRLFPVLVTQVGGSAGDLASYCSFTYTVKDLDGNVLVTPLSPLCSRARIV